MAMKAIQEITTVEAEALAKIEEAKKEAQEIIKAGEVSANKEKNRILEEAQSEILSLERKAKERGEEESQAVITEGDKKINEISNISEQKMKNAVAYLKERILKDGNS